MIYLASPYSHPDSEVREERFRSVVRATALLLRVGEIVYSPICHSHPIAELEDLPGDFAFWERHAVHMLRRSHSLVVLALDGYESSVGVRREIEIAEQLDIPRQLMHEGSIRREPIQLNLTP